MSDCSARIDASDLRAERLPAAAVPACAVGAAVAVRRRELGEDLDEALDDGPGGVEPEVLYHLGQARRLGGAGGEGVAVRAAHVPLLHVRPGQLLEHRRGGQLARTGWPLPRSRRSGRCPSSRRPRRGSRSRLRPGLQAVLVGAGQGLHVAVRGVDVRPPVLAVEPFGTVRRLRRLPRRRTGGTSGSRRPRRRPATASPCRGPGMSARAPARPVSRARRRALRPGRPAHPGRCRNRRSSAAGPSRASPRPAAGAPSTPRCRRA